MRHHPSRLAQIRQARIQRKNTIRPSRVYYWVIGRQGMQGGLRGAYETEHEAMIEGLTVFGSDFQVITSPHRDVRAVTRELKDIKLQKTGNLEYALQRVRHK